MLHLLLVCNDSNIISIFFLYNLPHTPPHTNTQTHQKAHKWHIFFHLVFFHSGLILVTPAEKK